MALRTIYLEDDEVLRKVSKPVTEFNQKLWDLLDDMAQTMYHAEGVGLAAVQVGILRQAVVIDVGEGLIELVNPKIVSEKGEQTDLEGCLSCPRQYGRVTRPAKVKVVAQDRNGKEFTIKGEELLARALCHEIDHLSGKIFKDIATEMVEVKEEE
ncbi:Peptide deformylase [uncultured Ruminococcus sp.]|uniref:Peptide deformylase n=1 Tax=Massiliimalia timonensis TaxID=1987501 RepID=A0A8J6PBZ2_9FIRM|nr:peptide deformylase [Massiliimalia timonensis]MBC8609571.1 peptide deformylase [Massiliimalia timonensis]MBS7175355.1 peptide deformylase [Clostridiales bacterium]SCH37001.1 Peptide deformylase [uncultured Ruminococcus sp.]SCH39033.1 Peptide deformylase [uncultured Clostridium sp.]